jgi:hypothetical protein
MTWRYTLPSLPSTGIPSRPRGIWNPCQPRGPFSLYRGVAIVPNEVSGTTMAAGITDLPFEGHHKNPLS